MNDSVRFVLGFEIENEGETVQDIHILLERGPAINLTELHS